DFHKQMTSSGDRYDMYGMTAAHKTLPLPTWVEVTNLENGKSVVVKVNDRGPFVGNRIIDLSYGAAKALDMIRAGTARVEVRALGSPEPSLAAVPAPAAASAPAATTAARQAATPAARPAAVPPPGASSARRSSFSPISEAAADELSPEERERGEAEALHRATLSGEERPAATFSRQRLFVQVGAFSSRENAARLVDRLKAQGYANAFVVAERDGLNRVRVGPLAGADDYDRVTGRLHALGLADTRLIAE
ncbi:MAG TPA: septal ring lytic transglycosylase RlpA family protein, partial [Gammaproteobacteria bacterium]|nr:septal ring lytic transglycosylase RlpA family protein [Gammaproteobacteria bacterium]